MQPRNLQTVRSPAHEKGAALIVGLVLLLVLTVLGVSGINMATLELTMTGNTQAAQFAFQAAETGIDEALSGPVDTVTPFVLPVTGIGDGTYTFEGQIACAATTPVPEGIYSEGGGARAIHFDATSTGRMPARNAVSVHTQSVYIVGPDPGNPNFNPAVSPGSC
ncbi:MAG TPA: PilX N-terminal domain-containing pilus assembly protein [Vicinamibacterales bacterium]